MEAGLQTEEMPLTPRARETRKRILDAAELMVQFASERDKSGAAACAIHDVLSRFA